MDSITTGLPRIDEILGGGLPRGHIVELLGAPSAGKSTVALNWLAAAQHEGLTTVWLDVDRTFDPAWAVQAGVTIEELVVARPDTGSQAAGILDHLLRTFSVDLVVVDSTAALLDTAGVDAAPEDLPVDISNGPLARMMRRCKTVIERSRTVVVLLSPQYQRDRQDITGYSPGSRVLTQYAAVRLAVQSKAIVMSHGACSGRRLVLTTIKNKFADPFQEALIDLDGALLRVPVRLPASRAVPPLGQGRNAG